MHRSKLPLTAWFWAAHLMSTHSNGMSARQLEDQLGVTYKTAWLLTQKLRRSMVDPERDPLEGVVEVDQAEIRFREGDAFFEPGNAARILVIGAVEVIDRDINQSKPRRKHVKYLDTRSGRIRLAMIADNTAGSIEAFVKANVKAGTTLLTDGHASYPGIDRLPSRSARRRKHGGTRCPALDPPSLLIVEAMGPWNVSWPAAQACRHLSQRIRFSLQSSFLSPCFVRNFAWAGRTSRTSELLGHRQPSQSSKGCQNNQAGASSPQDSNWDATGRRNASAPRQPGSPYQISNFTTCRRTWDSGISLHLGN
jgi:hypothetical protein